MNGTSGIGPVEPGEGTAGHDDTTGRRAPARAATASGRTSPRSRSATAPARRRTVAARRRTDAVRAWAGRHPRALLALAAACALAAAGGYLHSARPRPVPPAPPAPPPAPSQVVSLAYGEPVAAGLPGTALAFTVRIRTSAGPPVSIDRIDQPSRALRVMIRPQLPVVVAAGEAREVVVEIQAVDCVHVARNAGLPFLEVTLSNERQKEAHSYILGDRYAGDLSKALTSACPEDRDQASPTPS